MVACSLGEPTHGLDFAYVWATVAQGPIRRNLVDTALGMVSVLTVIAWGALNVALPDSGTLTNIEVFR